MRILIAVFGVIGLIGSADAQIVKDPPWNPEHINRLPPDVSSALCWTSVRRDLALGITSQLIFTMKYTCIMNTFIATRLRSSQCLHQVYHRYRLAKSFYGSRND